MSQTLPKVSLLIVTWNRRADLARCLDSALAQTYANKEVVVVDNASTDGTAAFVRQQYPDVRLVCAEVNLGCPSGRNFGVPHCRGDYIYMLDDDGWLQPDALEKSVQRAQTDPSIGVVLSRVHVVDGDRVTACYPANQEEPVYRADFSGGCSLLRRAALDEVGLFPDGFFRQGEESDLALRLLDAGWCCFLEPASVMFHKPSPQGRDARTFLYYTLRNANKTALRLYPMPWCLFRIGVNFLRAFRHLIARSYFLLPCQLLRALWGDLRQLSSQRRPVSPRTFWLFYRLNRQPSPIRPLAARPGVR